MDLAKVVFGGIQMALGLFVLYMLVFRRETPKRWFEPKSRSAPGSKTLVREEWGPVKKWAVLISIGVLIVGGFIAIVVVTSD